MEFNNQTAIYIQIVEYFYEAILQEKWKSKDRIPSVRQLAVELEVNPNTAMRAYNLLQEQGIIYNKRGLGFFVSENAKSEVLALMKKSFLTNELPDIFKKMDLLGISPENIKEKYADWRSH